MHEGLQPCMLHAHLEGQSLGLAKNPIFATLYSISLYFKTCFGLFMWPFCFFSRTISYSTRTISYSTRTISYLYRTISYFFRTVQYSLYSTNYTHVITLIMYIYIYSCAVYTYIPPLDLCSLTRTSSDSILSSALIGLRLQARSLRIASLFGSVGC